MRRFPKRFAIVVCLSFLFVLSAQFQPGFAGESSALQVEGYEVSGSVVVVTVSNPGSSPGQGDVVVEAYVGTTPSRSVQSVTVMPGQTADVPVGFAGTVTGVIEVGILEGNNPT